MGRTETGYRPAEGDVIAGRYRLEEQLGQGGMGEVWAAHHVGLDVRCAVKFILDLGRAELVARFEREARAVARVQSPNVVQVFDTGVWQGAPYMVMERLQGESLSQRLDRDGRLTPREALGIVEDVCRALTATMDHGVVHRDIKPDNIFLVSTGTGVTAKLIDFGIAFVAQASPASLKTKTGTTLGTPSYMSPEQIDGDSELDVRSDLWSLAIVMFESLTGYMPFDAATLTELFRNILLDPIPSLLEAAPDVPPALEAWWEQATQRSRQRRFQTPAAFARGLAIAILEMGELGYRQTSQRTLGDRVEDFDTLSGQSGNALSGLTLRRPRAMLALVAGLVGFSGVLATRALTQGSPAQRVVQTLGSERVVAAFAPSVNSVTGENKVELRGGSVQEAEPVRPAPPALRAPRARPAPPVETPHDPPPRAPSWTRDQALPPDAPGF